MISKSFLRRLPITSQLSWIAALILLILYLKSTTCPKCSSTPSTILSSTKNTTKSTSENDHEFLDSKEKQQCEVAYWESRVILEGNLAKNRGYYKDVFTKPFGVEPSFFAGKKVLDIGCGPRGTLEWSKDSMARICIDPLADKYGQLGGSNHSMIYIRAVAEHIPLPDNSMDIITSINNFDHVHSPSQSAAEIHRVLKPGGKLLIIVEIHDEARKCEPNAFDWSLLKMFHGMRIIDERHTEKKGKYRGTMAVFNSEFDHQRSDKRPGMMIGILEK